MNKEQQIAQLRLAAEILESGAEWEFETTLEPRSPRWTTPTDLATPVACIGFGFAIRIKPWTLGRSVNGFTLADGQEWHRTDWKREWLPVGTRPTILGETSGEMESLYPPDNDYNKWVRALWHTSPGVTATINHHRTNLPVPVVKPSPRLVPLGAGDVPPGSVYKRDTDEDGEWYAFLDVGKMGAVISNGGTKHSINPVTLANAMSRATSLRSRRERNLAAGWCRDHTGAPRASSSKCQRCLDNDRARYEAKYIPKIGRRDDVKAMWESLDLSKRPEVIAVEIGRTVKRVAARLKQLKEGRAA
jgi:hypothetical protein